MYIMDILNGINNSISYKVKVTSIFKDALSDDVKKKCAILIKDKILSQKARGMLGKEQIAGYKSYIAK